tara:strand:+ start:1220 stop:1924 length:705 start_codon:yes stop_codon:yes gene_type:complete
MDSKGTGLTLGLGLLVAFIGYILWQLAIGFNTKSDDIVTILSNSASGSAILKISAILISVGLVAHLGGLISTRGTASGTLESLGIVSVAGATVIWVANSGLGISLVEMGEKFVAASAGAAAGDAASAAAASTIATAGGYIQAISVGGGSIGALLAGIGWLCIGLAYRGSDVKGALSFIPMAWLAVLQGLVLIVAVIVINNVIDVDTGNQVQGIGFLLIVIWSLLRGIKLMGESD